MRKNIYLLLASTLLTVLAVEGMLRIPLAKRDTPQEGVPPELKSTFVLNKEFGYELSPGGQVRLGTKAPKIETLNNEGWRGPNLSLTKTPGTLRVLTLGDSIILSGTESYENTWQLRAKRIWERANPETPIEMINAGIGGYVAWQAKSLYDRRAAKYRPDWVIVHVDWNDLLFSTSEPWTPKTNLTDFEQAFEAKAESEKQKPSVSRQARDLLYRYSKLASLVRDARNQRWNRKNQERIIENHKKPSGLVFNQAALDSYLSALSGLHQAIKKQGGKMALLLAPASLTRALLDAPSIDQLCLSMYSSFPLSATDFVDWHERYRQAQRVFLAAHSDIVTIDAHAAFDRYQMEEARAKLFIDHVHFSDEGMEKIAEIVHDTMAPHWAQTARMLAKKR